MNDMSTVKSLPSPRRFTNGDDEFHPMTLDEASVEAQTEEFFVIDGLVTAGTTLFYGEPDAGKSLLAAGIITSLVTGEPFLGRAVLEPRRVAVCWSDDKAYAEYADRIRRVIPQGYGKDVLFYRMPVMRDAAMWERLHTQIVGDGCSLVIFDVLSQIIDGDINDAPPVAKFFDGVRRFTRDDMPALVLHHSSEKKGHNGQRSDMPMGHTSIRGYSRLNVFLSRNNGGKWTALVRGKWADTSKIHFLAPEWNTPRFEVTAEEDGKDLRSKSRQRSAETLDKRAEIAKYIVKNCQGMTKANTAKETAEYFNMTASTLAKDLSGPVYKTLLDYSAGQWIML